MKSSKNTTMKKLHSIFCGKLKKSNDLCNEQFEIGTFQPSFGNAIVDSITKCSLLYLNYLFCSNRSSLIVHLVNKFYGIFM